MMMDRKAIWLSKTFWANVVSVIGVALMLLIGDDAYAVMAVAGSALSTYGRIKAEKRIG